MPATCHRGSVFALVYEEITGQRWGPEDALRPRAVQTSALLESLLFYTPSTSPTEWLMHVHRTISGPRTVKDMFLALTRVRVHDGHTGIRRYEGVLD